MPAQVVRSQNPEVSMEKLNARPGARYYDEKSSLKP